MNGTAEEIAKPVETTAKADAKPPEQVKVETGSPEARERVLKMMFGGPPAADAKKDEKPGDQTPPGDKSTETAPGTKAAEKPGEKKGDEKKGDESKKEKPKAKQKAPADLPEVDHEELIQRTAVETGKAVGAAVVKANESAKPKETAPAAPELPEDEQDFLPVYEHLEKANPKYKGLVAKVVEFKRKGGIEDQYKAKWEEEHPDEEFDSTDKQHSAWYRKNAPPEVSDRDFNAAQTEIIEERVAAKLKREADKREAERAKSETMAKLEPMAKAAAEGLCGDAIRGFGEELAAKLADAGTKGGIDAIAEVDPIAADVIKEVVPAYQPLIAETVRVFRGGVSDKPTELQARVITIASQIEDHLASLPASQTTREVEIGGKTVKQRFLPLEKYAQVPPEDRWKFYMVGMEEVLGAIANSTQTMVGSKYSERKALVDRVTKKPAGGKSEQATETKKTEEKQQEKPRTQSPSVSGATTEPPPSKESKDAAATARERMGKVMGWR